MKHYTEKGCSIHYFESFAEFLPACSTSAVDAVMKANPGQGWRQEQAKFGTDRETLHWAGGLLAGATHKLAGEGMSMSPEALEIRDQINTACKPMVDQCFAWDVAGEQVDVGAYLSGEPECMLSTRQDQTRARKVVNILFNNSASCAVDPSVMRLRGLAMLAFVDALESTQRYRVSLYYAAASGRSMSSDNASGSVCIRLLDPSHRYDPQAVGFVLTHPGMFRRLMFNYWNTLPLLEAQKWGVANYAYGTPGTLRSLPKEIEDTDVAASECLHTGIQSMSEVYDTKSAIRWVTTQMSKLTVGDLM